MSAASLSLVCPAGTPAALDAALEAGADAVYCGYADATNARNFPGLNFSPAEMRAAATRTHKAGRSLYIAINTFPKAGDEGTWHRAVDNAADAGADAVILADLGLLAYAQAHHPALRLHLSVQAAASTPEAIRYLARTFGVQRVVLPRVLTLAEVTDLTAAVAPVETEVFAFGGMCVMAEGRCQLSSYVTGQSPNTHGVCSPAGAVQFRREAGGDVTARLGDVTIDRHPAGAPAGYPTLCKGRFRANGTTGYLFEEPTSLNAADHIPGLIKAGVRALKIEGRQRGRAYVTRVVGEFRRAIDAALSGGFTVPDLARGLASEMEGGRATAGAYDRRWR
ncbi:ubiquinone anaerobic biosynthesis protein UbiU [Nitrospirillum sp. BR 11828]|uniref:ubiquinone anaerobic biosynthesis protein UbiU n=1 Tax=Nitrospirillum sp. BR 11828 TaxID=3104325 RepID=UPI002ACA773A|nr:peptidase U32 family protein [Nitrospirillum sp. BR 11828]MDZ5645660.1 peptidase U32 family protein [Nitrospirillum sp. BR 11828]